MDVASIAFFVASVELFILWFYICLWISTFIRLVLFIIILYQTNNDLCFKGGFAKCYEVTDSQRKKTLAVKVVSKSLLIKPHQKEKMTQEISIHGSVHHKHIVGFHGFFEDPDNIYIMLELCTRRVSILFKLCQFMANYSFFIFIRHVKLYILMRITYFYNVNFSSL